MKVRHTIEEVGVVWRWEPVQLKDVAQVIELPMRVPAHSHVLVVWYAHVH